jgi:hypothetical protein
MRIYSEYGPAGTQTTPPQFPAKPATAATATAAATAAASVASLAQPKRRSMMGGLFKKSTSSKERFTFMELQKDSDGPPTMVMPVPSNTSIIAIPTPIAYNMANSVGVFSPFTNLVNMPSHMNGFNPRLQL